jgi:glutamate formiminotransferase
MDWVEAVPNVSEGRDRAVIDHIAAAFDRRPARLLHVDPNADAHRTVFTLAGPADAVAEALIAGAEAALRGIDMRTQRGAHPRVGAVDVVPIVPLWPSALAAAHRVAAMVAAALADDLAVPVYLYEQSARRARFVALPACRRGGWEALPARLPSFDDGPDLGPTAWSDAAARSGASVVGVRDLLVAMNFSIGSDDLALARSLAARLRDGGGPGGLPSVRAIGWAMPGYRLVQVSANLLDVRRTPAHRVLAALRALSPAPVLGAELIGLAPARVFADAALAAIGGEPPAWPPGRIVDGKAAADEASLTTGVVALGLDHLGEPAGKLAVARTLETRLLAAGFGDALIPPAADVPPANVP